jgi:hypothetical protein
MPNSGAIVKDPKRPARTLDPRFSGASQPHRSHRLPRFEMALVGVLLALPACRSGDVKERAAPARAAAPAAGGAPTRPTTNAEGKLVGPPASAPWHIPVGPKLTIEPGQGLGPIRFGATVETIERLIGQPCEEKTAEAGITTCRYSAHAVDFVLDAEGLEQIRVHRLGRLFRAGGKLEYGIFNGGFESGVNLGMLPPAVAELLGKPQATRKVEGENLHHTVEVYEYPGATLEFDQTKPDKLELGGVILDRPKS